MSLTSKEFSKGMTTSEYLASMTLNAEPITKIHEAVTPPGDAVAFFDKLAEPLRLAVFTEEWCADAVTTTPSILKLEQATKGLDARVFKRDANRELTDTFLPPHRSGTLPIFVVFDSEMREVARFVETAKELIPMLHKMEAEVRAQLAETEREKEFGQMGEETKTVVRRGRYAFRVQRAAEWGGVVIGAFTATVRRGLELPVGERPAVGGTEWPVPAAATA